MGNWVVTAKGADFQEIAKQYHISPVLARIIRNRDIIGMEEIKKYLYGTVQELYNPFLLQDMDLACASLWEAISQQKKIRIIGDYDVDGICSSYILQDIIRSLGGAVDVVIPHRMWDGYGLNEHLIRQAAKDRIDLIVTCDNGIAAIEQIRLAYELGMKVIVTDHHEPVFQMNDNEKTYILPKAEAVVDPKRADDTYPFQGICGACVAYKFAQALCVDQSRMDQIIKQKLEDYLEVVAIATICDVMELKDENRILVKEGLKRLQRTTFPGLLALARVNGIEIGELSAYHVGFVIGPCLNASGRLETAHYALELLEERDYKKAVLRAMELKNLNDSRKEMTETNVKNAIRMIEQRKNPDKILVVYLADCHESLAGIVAGRLREKYGRPCFVLTKAMDGIKGSGRSIDGYDMYEELTTCKSLLDKFGGHKMAAGVSLQEENLNEFQKMLNQNCNLTESDFESKVVIDVPLPMSYATEEFIQELKLLEPYGVGNPKPVFAQKNLILQKMSVIGKLKNVLKLWMIDETGRGYEVMHFGDVELFFDFLEKKQGITRETIQNGKYGSNPMMITYYPSLNEFRGRKSIQYVMTNYC